MSEVNHWPRCTTLRQVQEHFKDHPERCLRGKFYERSTGNRCAAGMVNRDGRGFYVMGSFRRVCAAINWVGPWHGVEALLVDWNDKHCCHPDRWPVDLASDEILDREWA